MRCDGRHGMGLIFNQPQPADGRTHTDTHTREGCEGGRHGWRRAVEVRVWLEARGTLPLFFFWVALSVSGRGCVLSWMGKASHFEQFFFYRVGLTGERRG